MKTKECSTCKLTKPLQDFDKQSSKITGYRSQCKQCRKFYYIDNKAQILGQKQEYYIQHKEEINLKHKMYRKTNQYKLSTKRSVQKAQRISKEEVIKAYGGKCSCTGCDETAYEFLTIDHINNYRAPEEKKTAPGKKFGLALYRFLKQKGFPKEHYRLLCMNCNFSIGKYKFCPHEREISS